ncbi:hypothetical protein L211DRAFT_836960 [Terfezia boudieri ATCC MYA-4762]|uniref:Uncharacterized protein n=1 Tax=Terfezia boudieri ATCC MYA-4762 TaxID=1051890 RepID=A0A3N4LV75_9PEZI|nr:hypothetical protein L211DRAFT_836960 [Terfezia boudieri ATCC MYA-4762]
MHSVAFHAFPNPPDETSRPVDLLLPKPHIPPRVSPTLPGSYNSLFLRSPSRDSHSHIIWKVQLPSPPCPSCSHRGQRPAAWRILISARTRLNGHKSQRCDWT